MDAPLNVLIIGSGGREHAMAWKMAQSPKLSRLYIAPGNAGTMACGANVSMDINDHAAVVRFCREKQIELVLVGPDICSRWVWRICYRRRISAVLGRSRPRRRSKRRKSLQKNLWRGIISRPRCYAAFSQLNEAIRYVQSIDYPVVIKASGLAAGKGVILPNSFDEAKGTLESSPKTPKPQNPKTPNANLITMLK